jgi:hypothetical protein
MNYREAIQLQIAALQELYDNAEGLRDAATDDEKEVWNNVRRLLPDVWRPLQRLDNSLSSSRAEYKLRGLYYVLSAIKEGGAV